MMQAATHPHTHTPALPYAFFLALFVTSSLVHAQQAGSVTERRTVPNKPITVVKDSPERQPIVEAGKEEKEVTSTPLTGADAAAPVERSAGIEANTGKEDSSRSLYPIAIPLVKDEEKGEEGRTGNISADEDLKGTITRTRTDQDAPKDQYAGKSREDLIKLIDQTHARVGIIIGQMGQKRQEYAAQRQLQSATLQQLEESIQEARDAVTQVHPAVHDLYAEDTAESHMNKADLFFSIGHYEEALSQYFILKDRYFDDLKTDADRAWVFFQIGECQLLQRRPKGAIDQWEKLNIYFRERGQRSADRLENKFHSFDEDPSASSTWAAGFWRRYARDLTEDAKSFNELVEARSALAERRQKLAAQASELLPSERLQLRR